MTPFVLPRPAVRFVSTALLLLSLALCGACAPRANARAGREGTSVPLCWWGNARWEDRGPLLVRGTDIPLARVRARWAGDQWKGATTTAVLRQEGNSSLLQGEWTGPGLVLQGDVDVGGQAVFRSFEPRRLGSMGAVLKGGHVRVLDALQGRALVVPSPDSAVPFRTDESLALEVPCDGLSLSASLPSKDPARAQLEQAGFDVKAKAMLLPPHAALPASSSPGGPTSGFFVGDEQPVRGFVVDRKENEARLVVPTRDGVVWVGWVAAEPLRADEGPPFEQPLPSVNVPSAGVWRTCSSHDFPLSLELQGRLIAIGTLRAGTPFSVGEREGNFRPVAIGLDWLELSPQLTVLAPSDAFDCPRIKQPEAW